MDNSKENLILQQQSSIPSFLTKTYDILENSNYSDIIQWNQDGKAFTAFKNSFILLQLLKIYLNSILQKLQKNQYIICIIKKPYEFAKKILPKYFKHNNYTSFIRQLNIYDFHKIKNELGKHEFKHNFFQKEKKHLLCEIKRKSIEQQEQLEENNQIQTNNNSQLSMSKLKNDYQQFHNEIMRVKAQQQVFQQTIAKFMTQNDYLINQNSLLWQEIYKIRDVDDKKIENFSYLLTTLIITINQYSQNFLLPSQQSSSYQTSSSDTVNNPIKYLKLLHQQYQYITIELSKQLFRSIYQFLTVIKPKTNVIDRAKITTTIISQYLLLLNLDKQDISLFDQGLTKKNQDSFKSLEFDAFQNGLAFYQKLMDLQQQQKLQEMQEGQSKLLIKQRK